MSCKCSKCDPQNACGCTDSALTTPCTYTDCSVGSERCADVQCAECVSYCGTTFEVQQEGGDPIIRIETGQRLDSIIQQLTLIIAKGLGACTASNLHHAPFNLFATSITKDSAIIQWNNVSSLSSTFTVKNATTSSALSTALASTIRSFTLTGLTPSTNYKIKVTSATSGGATCDSVVIDFTTLAA